MNKTKRWLIFCSVLVCLLASCYPPVNVEKQQATRNGLDTALAQLPIINGFTVIKTLVYESYDNEHGGNDVCYYAQGYVVAGSSLSSVNAVDYYAQSVQPLGWSPNSDQHEAERLLNRGAYERMVISSYEPEIEIQNAVGYALLKKTYTSVIVIRVEYILPKRDGC